MRLLSEIRNYMGNYHVKSGVYHYYRSEFAQAVSFLRRALGDEGTPTEGDRENARCYLTLSLVGLAEKLAADGEIEAGVEELRQASQVNPGYPDIHFRAARLLEQIGRGDDAIAAYRRAIECHADYLDARVALGHCLLAAGQVKEATEVFRSALKLKLERIQKPFDRGMKALGRGKIDESLEFLHRVFLAAPRLSDEYLSKALDWMRAGEFEKALDDLDRALDACPKYPDLHNFRGIVLCELERYPEAIESFGRSSELCPGHKVPRLNRAFAYIRAGRPQEAKNELESVLEKHPGEPAAEAGLAELREGRLADKRGLGTRG